MSGEAGLLAQDIVVLFQFYGLKHSRPLSPMAVLHLSKIIQYSTEYSEFFADPAAVECLYCWECNFVRPPAGELSVAISDQEPEGSVLLKNSQKTYLLIEIVLSERKWSRYFAPDPKNVLFALKDRISWPELFPLLRKAHEAAHPPFPKDPPDFAFLERVMTDAYHHIGGDFLREQLRS